MNTNPSGWLRNEILNGLSKLMTLSLNRQPSESVIEGTAGTWLEAICSDRAWDRERDTVRIRQAFTTLYAECIEWPPPAYLLRSMPAAPKQYYISTGELDGSSQRSVSPETQKIIDDLAKKLRVKL
ncbi:MAG: hypothetical protein ABI268_05410 [Rhodanobacter sp.]